MHAGTRCAPQTVKDKWDKRELDPSSGDERHGVSYLPSIYTAVMYVPMGEIRVRFYHLTFDLEVVF